MRIVLLGGGLGHIHYIRHKAKNLSSNVEVVLVNSKPHVFYAPAFEEVLTGRIPLQEAMIDLRKVCTLAGVTFIQSDVDGVETDKKLLKFVDRASLQYDFLSMEDLGEASPHHPKGFLENGFYTHDTILFFNKLQELESGLAKMRPSRLKVAVVGGGEQAIVLSRFLPEKLKKFSPQLHWEIFEKQECLLSSYQPSLRKAVEKELKNKDVLVRTQFLVEDVIESTLVNTLEPKQTFAADVIFFTTPSQIPSWLKKSSLLLTSDGVLDAHPHFVLKNNPCIMAAGEMIGLKSSERDIEEHARAIDHLAMHQEVSHKKEFHAIHKKDVLFFDGKALQSQWGFVRQSEKTYLDHQNSLKKQLEFLRAEKEQRHAKAHPSVEENTFVEKLKRRLKLDLNEEDMETLFEPGMDKALAISGWCEKEYKDVFNDHYLSSYYTGLDLMDQSSLLGGVPQYLRLYMSAPGSIKDVEILSQIVIGALRACKNHMPMKIHLCSQAMNTVQFSLGADGPIVQKKSPEPMAYMALTQPLGLYALLSQQGKSIWQGEWLSEIWSQLQQPQAEGAEWLKKISPASSLLQLTEAGFINDVVRYVGPEGWKVCVNLSQLPRWNGVNDILKEKPMDALVEKNWNRGFRFWSGRGETFPESQYLLWEPHLARPSVCLFIPPADLDAVAQYFAKMNHPLSFVGYVEQTIQKDQTSYKLSDWSYNPSRRTTWAQEGVLS